MNNKIGISVFLSTINFRYIHDAYKNGVRVIFLYLHIPEYSKRDFMKTCETFVLKLKQIGFKKIICDISPAIDQFIGEDPFKKLQDIGVNVFRLDYGYSDDEIIYLSKNYKIAINASQVKSELVKKINNRSHLIAFHNYYPLPGTGLSIKHMVKKDNMLRLLGIKKIYSFISGTKKFRDHTPKRGLPTLEVHRDYDSNIAALELLEIFNHDMVFFGDDDYVDLNNEFNQIPIFHIDNEIICRGEYEVRISNNFIRLKGTRMMSHSESGISIVEEKSIYPKSISRLRVGDVIICNNYSKRYKGEIMIVIRELNNNLDLQYFNFIGKTNKINAHDLFMLNKTKKIIIK